MSGNSILIDTNIALYLLNGDTTIADLLNGRDVYVSFITELELLGYFGIRDQERTIIEDLLNSCIIIELNQAIKATTVNIKQQHKLKLPDAIIAATSIHMNLPFISADKGFERIPELQFIRYDI